MSPAERVAVAERAAARAGARVATDAFKLDPAVGIVRSKTALVTEADR